MGLSRGLSIKFPWDKAREEASEKFFKSAVDSSGVDAYTGRMK